MKSKVDILGFYGDDRTAAWEEAMAMTDLLEACDATGRVQVRAEKRHGEWVVTATHAKEVTP